MKPIVIAYDISKNKTRRKVCRILKGWKLENQKSVYECRMGFRSAEELFLQLSEPLNLKTDGLLMVWLENHRKVLHRGVGTTALNKYSWHIR